MRFNEIFTEGTNRNSTNKNRDVTPKSTGKGEVKQLSNLGSISFGTGITDKNKVRTPHTEIHHCMEMYETFPIVQSGVDQLMLWLFPNTKLKFWSEQNSDVELLDDWVQQRVGVTKETKNIMHTNLICGNAPVETYRTKNGELDNFFSFPDASRIYRNVNGKEDGSDAFIFELLVGTRWFKYRGEVRMPNMYNVQYIKNYQYNFQQVHGIPISRNEMTIYMSGWSRDNLYGRSELASALDAFNIIQEIMSSWDTIAKTRQIDQKIISVADGAENLVEMNDKDMKRLEDDLEDTSKSYIMFNVPLKFVQQDVEVSGKYDLMEGVFDICRRMVTMSLLPQHLTPWSDSATTQGSEAAMAPLKSRIKAKQNDFINWFNETILSELKEQYNLDDSCTLVLDEPKVIPDEQYIRTITDLMRDNIIDVVKARQILNKLGIVEFTDEELEEKSKEDEEKESYISIGKNKVNSAKVAPKTERKESSVEEQRFNIKETNTLYKIYDGEQFIKQFKKNAVSREQVELFIKEYMQYLNNEV